MTIPIPHITVGKGLSARQESNERKPRTDDQRRAMPHAVLVDGVIPQ